MLTTRKREWGEQNSFLSFFPSKKNVAKRVKTVGVVDKKDVTTNLGSQIYADCNYTPNSELSSHQISHLFKATLDSTAKEINARIRNRINFVGTNESVHSIAVIEESHLAIHYYPLTKKLYIDVYTCGSRLDTDKAIREITNSLNIEEKNTHITKRIRGIRLADKNVLPNSAHKRVIPGVAREEGDKYFFEKNPKNHKRGAIHATAEFSCSDWSVTNNGPNVLELFKKAFNVSDFLHKEFTQFHVKDEIDTVQVENITNDSQPIIPNLDLTLKDISKYRVSTNGPVMLNATVSIAHPFIPGEDFLTFTQNANTGNIVAHFDSASGVITLTSPDNSATREHYQAALRSVSYCNNSPVLRATPCTIKYAVKKEQGVSVICVLEDGATITVHSWPEYNYFPVDIFIPEESACKPDDILNIIAERCSGFGVFKLRREAPTEPAPSFISSPRL